MPNERKANHVGLKMMAGSAVGILLSWGLCGVGFYLARNIHDGAPPTLDIIGGFVFVASAFGFLVGVVTAIVEAITSASKGQ